MVCFGVDLTESEMPRAGHPLVQDPDEEIQKQKEIEWVRKKVNQTFSLPHYCN